MEGSLTRIFTNLINNMLKHGKDTVIINLAQKKDKLVAEFINHALDFTAGSNFPYLLIASSTADRARSSKNHRAGLISLPRPWQNSYRP